MFFQTEFVCWEVSVFLPCLQFYIKRLSPWRPGIVVITTAQLHSTKSELRFCAGSSTARGVLEIRDGEDP